MTDGKWCKHDGPQVCLSSLPFCPERLLRVELGKPSCPSHRPCCPMHFTEMTPTLWSRAQSLRGTPVLMCHMAEQKKEKNVVYRNCKGSVSFPPGFCNHVLFIFLNTRLCPISVCEAYTDNVGSQAMDTKALARLHSEQTKREKCAIGDFVMCSKMKWLAQWKTLLWLI